MLRKSGMLRRAFTASVIAQAPPQSDLLDRHEQLHVAIRPQDRRRDHRQLLHQRQGRLEQSKWLRMGCRDCARTNSSFDIEISFSNENSSSIWTQVFHKPGNLPPSMETVVIFSANKTKTKFDFFSFRCEKKPNFHFFFRFSFVQ